MLLGQCSGNFIHEFPSTQIAIQQTFRSDFAAAEVGAIIEQTKAGTDTAGLSVTKTSRHKRAISHIKEDGLSQRIWEQRSLFSIFPEIKRT